MSYPAIPDLSSAREIKDLYRTYPIDVNGPWYNEEVVPISEFGIKGSSYYSQPNKMTGEPLPGINPNALLRRSAAERLERASRNLRLSKDIAKILGGQVELIVRDALRSAKLQQHLYETVWPNVLKDANPDWDDEKLKTELPKFISKPGDVVASPTPHMTGGAVDVNIVYKDGSPVNFGHIGGKIVSETDYHEGYSPSEEFPVDKQAKLARRILYWTMLDEEFSNNPTEWWHYSFGDQMWALFNSEHVALYGAVEQAPDLITDN